MSARSLAARLALLQQGMTLAVIVVFAGSALWLTARVLRGQQDSFLSATALRLARSYDDELVEQPDPARAAAEVLAAGATPGIRIEFRDPSGRSLASSIPRLDPSSPGRGGAESTRGGARVAEARTASGGIVRASMTDALHRASITALGWSLLVSAIPLFTASLLLGRWIARRALQPLSAMADRVAGISIEKGVGSVGEPTGFEEVDRLAESFNRLLERLDHALRAERRFTADASHELRTPLTVLSGELEIARGRAGGDASLGVSLAGASEQVRSMRELVEAILLLHRSGEAPRVGEAEFEPVNLCDMTREVIAETMPRYRDRHADLRIEAADEVLVRGHPALLASALRNLVDNALKFTRAGDRVGIAIGEACGIATVSVDDAGPGIPRDQQERIFDPFFRGAEARAGGGGFGLGLPILRRVARVHGGDVVVGPSPLGGARFALTLPLLGRWG